MLSVSNEHVDALIDGTLSSFTSLNSLQAQNRKVPLPQWQELKTKSDSKSGRFEFLLEKDLVPE